jgi:hypothetical protein
MTTSTSTQGEMSIGTGLLILDAVCAGVVVLVVGVAALRNGSLRR